MSTEHKCAHKFKNETSLSILRLLSVISTCHVTDFTDDSIVCCPNITAPINRNVFTQSIRITVMSYKDCDILAPGSCYNVTRTYTNEIPTRQNTNSFNNTSQSPPLGQQSPPYTKNISCTCKSKQQIQNSVSLKRVKITITGLFSNIFSFHNL